ncbi:hypothetical protein GCM10009850_119140 [Nonomuraea monospora]|uniref:Uncharacterized protein n=1 Tax=Nonomuraea monospora TaxID=568818 RepID=A0ABN3D414_9ACTN
MLPEVKAYYDALDEREHSRELNRVRAAHPVPAWDPTMAPVEVAAYFEADNQLQAALRELAHAHKHARSEAYQKLIGLDDPLVRFLLTDPEVQAFPSYVAVVLKALPMPREELEDFGERRDWCQRYGRLFERAEQLQTRQQSHAAAEQAAHSAAGQAPPPLLWPQLRHRAAELDRTWEQALQHARDTDQEAGRTSMRERRAP